jgi:hypothetical protein
MSVEFSEPQSEGLPLLEIAFSELHQIIPSTYNSHQAFKRADKRPRTADLTSSYECAVSSC